MGEKATSGCSGFMSRMALIAFLFMIVAMWPFSDAEAARVKDLASIKGVRNNQLIGYGLVVGLNGTGDGRQASFTIQGLKNMLENMGIHVDEGSIKVKNTAGVVVSAVLPPFVKVGQTIDVTISSLGDCSSLEGGTLLVTPLKGLDGKVYAIAQGAVSIGGFETPASFGSRKTHLTVARIPSGATIEKEVPVSFAGKQEITISLNIPDFTTVSRMVDAIDSFLGGEYAEALDGATVVIGIPEHYAKKEVALLSALENIHITPDGPAKVVMDERTGTVVMGKNVKITQLALSHGNLSLQVSPQQRGTPPSFIDNENISARDEENRLVKMAEGATLGEVVRALNSVGVTPRDLIAILQSIKASGALQAELEII